MARNLTDKQQRFLDVLFDEANGDVVAAKDLLDRAGLGKVDKVDVTSGGGIFYLPPKEGDNQ